MEPTETCPELEQLHLYHAALIFETEVEPLERHLEHCPRCVAKLDGLSASDPLMKDLLVLDGPVEPNVDLRLTNLMQRVKAMCDISSEECGASTCEHVEGTTPLPAWIGRYRILEKIGAGGMGVVHKAHDSVLNRLVALKVPRSSGHSQIDAKLQRRFLREAQAAAQVGHPNVCPIHDVGEHEGQAYVVMDFIEGKSLAERLTKIGRFEDYHQATSLVCQVADALQAVHERGIVHRDLKPANVLLDLKDRPLLTDFGVAFLEGHGERLTVEGTILGTPAYLSPEQIDATLGEIGPRSDTYSLGVVLYQMLTGHLPFAGTPAQIFHRILNQDPTPLTEHRQDLPAAFIAMVEKATARAPEDRFASAGEFAQALKNWQASGSVTHVFTPAPARPPQVKKLKGKSRRRLALPSALVALAALVVLGSVFRAQIGQWLSPSTAAPSAPTPTVVPAKVPLKGSIDLRIRDPMLARRQDVRLLDPAALPLKPGDLVHISVKLSREAYLYLVLIDAAGSVAPVYPWEEGEWDKRPPKEKKHKRLEWPAAPAAKIGFFEVEVKKPGMDTLVLLARETPLPREMDLAKALGKFSEQPARGNPLLVLFENGKVVQEDRDRGFVLAKSVFIDDPLCQAQVQFMKKLRGQFDYVAAISYAVVEKR